METIGFIGLGAMGEPIARRLLTAGYGVRVFNRTPAKAKSLIESGATLASSAHDAASPGGIAMSIVADDAALESVADDALARRLGSGGVHISMSTVRPDTTQRLAALHARHGATLIAAPVFGHPSTIVDGKLWVMLGGNSAAKARAMPVLQAIAQHVRDVSEFPQHANVVKLAGNFLGFSALEALAEAAILAEANDLPRAALLGALTETLFSAPMYKRFAGQIVSGDFSHAEFTAKLGLKDMTYVRDAARGGAAAMPVLDVLCDRFRNAVDKGRGTSDASVMAVGAAEAAGLDWHPKTA